LQHLAKNWLRATNFSGPEAGEVLLYFFLLVLLLEIGTISLTI